MLKQHKPQALKAVKSFTAFIGVVILLSHPIFADTVYRCGEAYSTSSQCGSAAATEVKPSSVIYTTKPASTANDLREAQVLEKRRLQAEHQATQIASIGLSRPSAPPDNGIQSEPLVNNRHESKHARQSSRAYFTAMVPKKTSKKKSSPQASPAHAESSP